MTVSLGASCSAHSFNILFGMLSGPEVFDGFTLDSSFFNSVCSDFNRAYVVFLCFCDFL